MTTKEQKQCKACPWKTSTVPERDIPDGYCKVKHENLRSTIADPTSNGFNPVIRAMACHEFPVGKERVCVGWLGNQLGPGNNIALRMLALKGGVPKFKLVGEQHARFEDTLPREGAE